MKTALTRLTASLFILAVATPLLFVLSFTLQQRTIKNRMKEKLEEEYLQTVVLSDQTIQWEENGKEIWIDNKLFDVESYEIKDGKTIVHGLFDESETNLKQNFQKDWKKNLADQNHFLGKIFQSLGGLYCNTIPEFNSLSAPYTFAYTATESRLTAWVSQIPTPPPQC